jgi:hypothetical protein
MATTDAFIKKGKDFEEYACKYIFHKDYYETVEKTHAYTETDFPRSNLNPDFKFSNWKTKAEFWVEAKIRKGLYNGKILDWEFDKKQTQLDRYKECNKTVPVLLIIGVGENINKLSSLYLVPLNEVKGNCLYIEDAKKYEIKLGEPVNSDTLNKLLTDWKPTEKKEEQKPLSVTQPPQKSVKYKRPLIIASVIAIILMVVYFFNSSNKKTPANDKEEIIKNINKYITISPSTPKRSTNFWGNYKNYGINKWNITVFNRTDCIIEKVRVKISYFYSDGHSKVVPIEFSYLGKGSPRTKPAPDDEYATKVICELDGIKSSCLGL